MQKETHRVAAAAGSVSDAILICQFIGLESWQPHKRPYQLKITMERCVQVKLRCCFIFFVHSHLYLGREEGVRATLGLPLQRSHHSQRPSAYTGPAVTLDVFKFLKLLEYRYFVKISNVYVLQV